MLSGGFLALERSKTYIPKTPSVPANAASVFSVVLNMRNSQYRDKTLRERSISVAKIDFTPVK